MRPTMSGTVSVCPSKDRIPGCDFAMTGHTSGSDSLGTAVPSATSGGDCALCAAKKRAPLHHVSDSRRRSRLSAHFVKRERKPLSAIAANPCDTPAQLANESFPADHVRFGNSVGAVVQVLMRSDVPTAEAFFRDHLDSGALLNEAAIVSIPRQSRGL
jgi:hypothetical protein